MKVLGYELAQIRKAVAGGCAGLVPIAAKAVSDLDVSRTEVGQMLGAFVLGFGVVFFAPANAGARRTRSETGVVAVDISLAVGFLGGLFLGFLLWHR